MELDILSDVREKDRNGSNYTLHHILEISKYLLYFAYFFLSVGIENSATPTIRKKEKERNPNFQMWGTDEVGKLWLKGTAEPPTRCSLIPITLYP